MKLLLLMCFVFAASGINAYPQVAEEKDILKLTQKMNAYVTECIAEENIAISPAVTSAESDDDMKKVTICFFQKAGVFEPDGKLNPDGAMAILTLLGVEKSDAEDLLRECTSITGFDAKDTVYAIFKCLDNGVKA